METPSERGFSAEIPPAPPLTPIAPIPASERIVVIDVLRGFAVFGILLVNMGLFSAPLYVELMGVPWWTSTVDRAAQALVRFAAEGKFYLLFSFLFGLGMAIQMQRVEGRGAPFVGLYARRLFILLGLGLGHALLLWFGDILAIYALLGFPLLLFRKRSDRTLLIWAVAVYLLPLLVVGGCTALIQVAQLHPEAAAEIERGYAHAEAEMTVWAGRSQEIYAYGSFGDMFWHRLVNQQDLLPGTLIMLPIVFAMFLLGLWAGRRDLLRDPARYRPVLRRIVCWALPVGLLCNAFYALAFVWTSRMRLSWTALAGYVAYTIGAPLLSAGYAAALILLYQRAGWPKRLAPLAAVGCMALSNYLLQTLICTTLFYSYGFGLFGAVGPARGVLLTILIYALQVPLSTWWLRHFQFGPLEWLWRSLTYGRWQRLRAVPGDCA